jgi:serine/threonine-protein phosphatase 2A regulatory subunit B
VSQRAYISGGVLKLPKRAPEEDQGYEGIETQQFKNCHSYNINSLSVSPDGENFLSADALRINMWNFENPLVAYQVLDLAPSNIEELSEIITHVEFHKKRADLFLFSSSNSYFRMCDLRVSSDFRKNSTTF